VKAQEQAQFYARAIYETSLESWLKGLAVVRDKLNEASALSERLGQGDLAFSERQTILDGVVPAGVPQGLKNLLYTMLRDGHLNLLDGVVVQLERLAATGPGLQTAVVTSAVELGTDQKDQFRQKLKAEYGSQLAVDFQIDPLILGGVVIQVADKVLDASVASKLDTLRDRLLLR
jgi:F-type H+-transporting ATPase subunit delta